MPLHELRGTSIESYADLESIHHTHESEFARFLLHKKNLGVEYEPVEFRVDGPASPSHIPDFRLTNLVSGKESYIELTTSPLHEFKDPKHKQRRIVEEVSMQIGENILYLVLYAQNLKKIQMLNPELELDFFVSRHKNYYAK